MARKHGRFGGRTTDGGEPARDPLATSDGAPARTRLPDVVRDPGSHPLAAAATLLIACAFAYQAVAVALTHHPVVGALVAVVAAVAYRLADRLFAIHHRAVVAELARAGELDRVDGE